MPSLIPRRLVAIAALIAAPFAAPLAARAQAPDGCVVAALDGAATLRLAGAAAPALQGQAVARDAVVVTGAEARMTIRCGWGATVVIGPGSEVELGGLVAPSASPGPVMRLLQGAAGFLVKLTGGARFGVRTPSAVAAVRATEWALVVEDGATALFVREGAVALRGGDGAALLTAGQGIDVTAAGALGPVVDWGAPRIAALDAALGPDWAP